MRGLLAATTYDYRVRATGIARASPWSVIATATTGATGRAMFEVSGGRGTYRLAVTGVSKTGYVLGAGASVLSKSITR